MQEIDFFLWPRNDIDKIVCLLFSRWKGEENSEYRLIQVKFCNIIQNVRIGWEYKCKRRPPLNITVSNVDLFVICNIFYSPHAQLN